MTDPNRQPTRWVAVMISGPKEDFLPTSATKETVRTQDGMLGSDRESSTKGSQNRHLQGVSVGGTKLAAHRDN
ncbi:hypothetical protein CVT26_008889 [Gymnopilus dilepis]|uniref:Uncharacterized protein n=1 Tax=Gymnopilus dilepis TaxID=231916 RepID=A0A409YAZ6_9AGAR|nr:hypothetical protein CVT26_008889 [Gymnopilus dilepis]